MIVETLTYAGQTIEFRVAEETGSETSEHIKRLSGPWPYPCFACGSVLYVDRYIDLHKQQTLTRFHCPCGFEDTFKRPLDIEHDLIPFPHPGPTSLSPTRITKTQPELLVEILGELKQLNRQFKFQGVGDVY